MLSKPQASELLRGGQAEKQAAESVQDHNGAERNGPTSHDILPPLRPSQQPLLNPALWDTAQRTTNNHKGRRKAPAWEGSSTRTDSMASSREAFLRKHEP